MTIVNCNKLLICDLWVLARKAPIDGYLKKLDVGISILFEVSVEVLR